jgi:ribonuclease G
LLRLFRRRKPTPDERAAAASAPTAPPETVSPKPAQAGSAEETPARKRRRRGSRGGRGRKRTGTGAGSGATAQAQAEEPKAETAKKEEPRPERRPAARKQRAPRRKPPPRRPPLPPAKRELLISVDVSEQRVAVVEDDKVAEAYLERPERRSIAGNIYKGVVDNVLPGMEAAFIEIGLEKNGFLYVDEVVVPELEGRAQHGRRIQDLLSRGQEVLVQAVKDPMKSKGARLTTEISLPGRFVVFVPSGEGLGVSRRLEEDERIRLRDIVKRLEVKKGGVIVRTAAEGASAEDIERDLVFLQRLWKTIEARAKSAKGPMLAYQEAELPLRVIRDLFTDDFERALVDHERTYKRILGYLKKTSPHMAERVQRYREKTPLMESSGVEAEIRSTLSRRVDLPSGGYLVFDYAEAFTVIDVNTGRFVGGRGKGSGGRLEDTITKNNLEAVKEVVRQLRLRDVGGIIVIDFIDMANPKNRATVEEALKSELERDRTKTYVVEISPLGLVEMTRQNVTDGPREILTRKCTVCGGDGVVLSETSAAVDAERRLRGLAASAPRTKAFKVELNAKVASVLIGPGAARLAAIEEETKRRFLIQSREDVPTDHFEVLGKGTLESLAPETPVQEGAQVDLKLVEVARHDVHAAIGKLDGLAVCVGDASGMVGKTAKVRIERVLNGTAYATLVTKTKKAEAPITAEGEAEKPTRKPPARKGKVVEETAPPEAEAEGPVVEEPEAEEPEAEEPTAAEAAPEGGEAAAPKKKTRRGSRGGRRRKKKPADATAATNGDGTGDGVAPKIHIPDPQLGREEPEPEAEAAPEAQNGAEQPKPKKKTRRGSRGGRRRRKSTTTQTSTPE